MLMKDVPNLQSQGITQFLQAYPEPAVWISGDGTAYQSNDSFNQLPIAGPDGAWWMELVTWALQPPGGTLDYSSTLQFEGHSLTLTWLRSDLETDGMLLTSRDLTAATNLNQALADSRHRFRDLADLASDFAWETDATGRFVYVSPAGTLGRSAAVLIGQDAELLLAPETALTTPFHTQRPMQDVDLALRDVDGRTTWVTASIRPVWAQDGTWFGTRGVWREVTQVRDRDARMASALTRDRLLIYLGNLLRDTAGPEDQLDDAARVIARSVGAASATLLRRGGPGTLQVPGRFIAQDLVDPSILPEVSQEDWQSILRDLEAQGGDLTPINREFGAFTLTAIPTVYRHRVNGALLVILPAERGRLNATDVDTLSAISGQLGLANSNAAFVEQLRFLAERDDLTGLYNRRAIMAFLEDTVTSGTSGALVFVDLNNFKQVNDRLGHQRGDEVLTGLADHFAKAMTNGDRAARIGGDEYLVWLADATRDRAEEVGMILTQSVSKVLTEAELKETEMGLAVGVVWTDGRSTVDTLVARADQLMYEAKAASKGDAARGTVIVLEEGGGLPV